MNPTLRRVFVWPRHENHTARRAWFDNHALLQVLAPRKLADYIYIPRLRNLVPRTPQEYTPYSTITEYFALMLAYEVMLEDNYFD